MASKHSFASNSEHAFFPILAFPSLRSTAPVLVALLTACAHSPLQQANGPLAAAVEKHAEANHFSGTILVANGDRVSYRRSFGIADRAFEIPATDDTRYRIASITKLFTAALVLQLADEGKLDLHKPINVYLADFPGKGSDRITTHHLLNHTSGLEQFDRIASLEEALTKGVGQYQRPQTSTELLRYCCSGDLRFAPASKFDYNNADYIVLGRIIEKVTGKTYEAALRERILVPLRLENTGIAKQDSIVPRLAPTYYWRDDTKQLMNDLPVYYQNWDAAGGMYSTASDVLAFAQALYDGRIIKTASLAALLKPGLDDYGYGLWSYAFKRNEQEFRVAKRPGSIMGANAVLYRLIDRKQTIVILGNTNRADLDEFAQRIADLLVAAK
jgi:D-alanyl-D-alanine carboxypeptidase